MCTDLYSIFDRVRAQDLSDLLCDSHGVLYDYYSFENE